MENKDRDSVTASILDAAIACKIEAAGGYVSITQISSRAGLSDRTVNRYFPDKDILIYQAAARYLRSRYDALAEVYDAADKSSMNARERLVFLMRLQGEAMGADKSKALMFVSACTVCMNTGINLKVSGTGFDMPVRQRVQQCVEEGRLDGSIKADIEPFNAYLLIVSSFNGLVQRLVYHCNICGNDGPWVDTGVILREFLETLEKFLLP